MNGTVAKYNDVEIRNVETKRFEQTLEYDESGTDLTYHRFIVRVCGSVHANIFFHYGTFYPPIQTPLSAVDAAIEVQKRLTHPRAQFEYSVGGQVLLAANANPESPFLDTNNGPKPKVLSLTRVVGKNLFEIEFEIEICRVYCGTNPSASLYTYGAQGNAAVLNNRWSMTDERDKDFYSVHTIEGTLRVSHISHFPHLYRYLCVPPLQRGYRREAMRFVDSPDGLTLKYQIIDRQKFAAPPPPAVDWEATYSESSGVGGALGFGEVNVRLTGAPDTPKSELIDAAAAVIKSRLTNINKTFYKPGEGEHGSFLMKAGITEHMHDNVIQAHALIQHAGNQQRWLNVQIELMGTPLSIAGYDPKVWPSPQLFDGSSPVGIFAKYLQSPCTDIHGIPQFISATPEGDDDPGNDDKLQGTIKSYRASEPLEPDDDTGASQSQRTGPSPYSYLVHETHYDIRDGLMQLPIARWGGTSTPSSPQPSSVMIAIHNQISSRSTIIHAERIGALPELPKPYEEFEDVNGITHKRKWQRLITQTPDLLADGKTQLFKCQFRLDYCLERAPTETEKLEVGATPVSEGLASDNRLDGNQVFKDGVYT